MITGLSEVRILLGYGVMSLGEWRPTLWGNVFISSSIV